MAHCKANGRTAFVSFITAGFPTKDHTVKTMLAMQVGQPHARARNARGLRCFGERPAIDLWAALSTYDPAVEHAPPPVMRCRSPGGVPGVTAALPRLPPKSENSSGRPTLDLAAALRILSPA